MLRLKMRGFSFPTRGDLSSGSESRQMFLHMSEGGCIYISWLPFILRGCISGVHVSTILRLFLKGLQDMKAKGAFLIRNVEILVWEYKSKSSCFDMTCKSH